MFTIEELIAEASRCIDCKTKPCMVACPAHNDIPGALKLLKQHKLDEARVLWAKTSVLPEICGALCQNETLCVGNCTLNKLKKPIRIGEIEEALAHHRKLAFVPHPEPNGKTHLVIGLGPSGIANAIRMAEAGYRVVAMDRQKQIGGSVNNLVPDFRYDKAELTRLQERLIDLGVELRQGVDVGESIKLKDLISQYDSVFIGHGLDSPQLVPVATEGVEPYYAVDLLDKHRYTPEQLDAMLGKDVAIVGLGNVAVDMARTLIRQNKNVTILYRRTIDEAPAGKKDIMEAVEEGAIIKELLGPIRFYKSGKAKVLDCEVNCLIREEGTSRSRIEVVPDSLVKFEIDDLIFATGQASSDHLFRGTDLQMDPVLSPYHTNHPRVFVGGDRVNRHKRIVDAMVSGLEVAKILIEADR